MSLYIISDIHFEHPKSLLFSPSRIKAIKEYFNIKESGIDTLYEFAVNYKMQTERFDYPQNIVELSKRYATRFDKMIVEKYNCKVLNTDTVYCLGDVSWGNIDNAALLNGKKYLIIGNHDEKLTRFSEFGWHILYGESVKIEDKIFTDSKNNTNRKRSYLIEEINGKRVMFTHYPIFYEDKHDSQIVADEKLFLADVFTQTKCDINIHGHIHEAVTQMPNCINVCVEHTGFEPIEINELLMR